MENLVIICGHQKLLGKVHVFGAEFAQVAKKEADGIPFILKICATEIENRALSLQVCGDSQSLHRKCLHDLFHEKETLKEDHAFSFGYLNLLRFI